MGTDWERVTYINYGRRYGDDFLIFACIDDRAVARYRGVWDGRTMRCTLVHAVVTDAPQRLNLAPEVFIDRLGEPIAHSVS